ncbi:MAG TPA: response regulator [Terriglobia bacterium]|nr:response regulator [Terriglobia bacterium]
MVPKKILVVEDDPDLQLGIQMRLEATGYQVVVAGDASSALRAAQKEKPDLALLDIGLPEGSGFLVAQQLKTLDAEHPVPTIFMTGREPSTNRQRAGEEKAFAYFQKPFDNDDLLAAIRIALGEWARTQRQIV